MQVGFSPVNIKSPVMNRPQRQQQDINFGVRIPVKLSTAKPMDFAEAIERGAHEDSKENRGLLKEVVNNIKKRSCAKWDVPEIKTSITKMWGKDEELDEIFKGF